MSAADDKRFWRTGGIVTGSERPLEYRFVQHTPPKEHLETEVGTLSLEAAGWLPELWHGLTVVCLVIIVYV